MFGQSAAKAMVWVHDKERCARMGDKVEGSSTPQHHKVTSEWGKWTGQSQARRTKPATPGLSVLPRQSGAVLGVSARERHARLTFLKVTLAALVHGTD